MPDSLIKSVVRHVADAASGLCTILLPIWCPWLAGCFIKLFLHRHECVHLQHGLHLAANKRDNAKAGVGGHPQESLCLQSKESLFDRLPGIQLHCNTYC
jgi:hypothetical protein